MANEKQGMVVEPTQQAPQGGGAMQPASPELNPAAGTAGLNTQLGGAPTTVSGVERASGGMGELVLPEVDKRIFMFERDQNAFMQLMLSAKRVNVKSMEVKHYALDQGTPIVTVQSANGNTITLVNADKGKVRAYDTLMVKKVKGYEFVNGQNVKSRRPLQLFVTAVNNNGSIECVAINGIKAAATDQYGDLPTDAGNIIVQGTKLVRMANAMYETQKWVDPNTVIPVPDDLYLQKRGMTSVVSAYLADQNMEIPYDEAIKAEAQLREFKAAGNRTLLISQPSKILVRSTMGDDQWDYTTTGVRWQVKREIKHRGPWTYEDIIALIKTYYGGADKPKSGILLMGSNLALALQLIDWSKHPEVKMEPYTNETLGWKVTRLTSIFGDLQFKLEETLNDCGYENSGIIIGENRLVHYVRKGEANYTEDVQGEEAKRSGVLVSDALGLKGNCHIWIDGDDDDEDTAPDAQEFILWGSDEEPKSSELKDGVVYVFAKALTLKVSHVIDGETIVDQTVTVEGGEAYKYKATADSQGNKWFKFYGAIAAE